MQVPRRAPDDQGAAYSALLGETNQLLSKTITQKLDQIRVAIARLQTVFAEYETAYLDLLKEEIQKGEGGERDVVQKFEYSANGVKNVLAVHRSRFKFGVDNLNGMKMVLERLKDEEWWHSLQWWQKEGVLEDVRMMVRRLEGLAL